MMENSRIQKPLRKRQNYFAMALGYILEYLKKEKSKVIRTVKKRVGLVFGVALNARSSLNESDL